MRLHFLSVHFLIVCIQCFNFKKKEEENNLTKWTSKRGKTILDSYSGSHVHIRAYIHYVLGDDIIFFSASFVCEWVVFLLFSRMEFGHCQLPLVEFYSNRINLYFNSKLGIVHMNCKGSATFYFVCLPLHNGYCWLRCTVKLAVSIAAQKKQKGILCRRLCCI